jgi:hypothetical protein
MAKAKAAISEQMVMVQADKDDTSSAPHDTFAIAAKLSP